MQFTPHCNYELEIRGQILFSTMLGVWNEEGTLEYFDMVKRKAASICKSKWCRIVNLQDFEGGPMEVMDVLKQIQHWSLENNCVQLILVAPRSLNRSIIEQNRSEYTGVTYADAVDEALEVANQLLTQA